jgi:glycosyltransferase involved in cell wall biosynthesis
MKKINILEITHDLGIGGTQKTMQLYCRYLNKNKFNVYACGFLHGGPREKNINKYVKDLLLAKGNEEKVIEFIKKNNIEIFHFHGLFRNKTTIKLLKVLKFCKENNIKTIETSPFSLFDKEVDDLIDIRLFVSKTNIIKYIWKYNNQVKNLNNFTYIYNPLDIEDLEKYILTKNEKIQVRRKYGISKNDFVIGKLAQAALWKWSDEIIDVVPFLIKKIPNLKVVIRSLPKQKLSKIKRMGIEKYFILLPETSIEEEIVETFQVMDIMLHTSRIGETFGVAIAEAMYFGIPIVTVSTDFMQFTLFDRDNAQMEVVENGKNGFVANSIKEIAGKIMLLKENKNIYNLISKSNTKKAEKFFVGEKIVREFENIILNNKLEKPKISIDEYRRTVIKDSFYRLLKINITALYEYLRFYVLKGA